jgi:hypothetical protein
VSCQKKKVLVTSIKQQQPESHVGLGPLQYLQEYMVAETAKNAQLEEVEGIKQHTRG